MVLVAVRAWTSAWWRVGIASCALMLVLGPADGADIPRGDTCTGADDHRVQRRASLQPRFCPLFVLGNLTILDGLTALCVIDWPARLNTLNAG